MRRTSRRSASPDRIAAVVSSCSRSRRVTGLLLGRHGLVCVSRRSTVHSSCADGCSERRSGSAWEGTRAGIDVIPAPGGSALARSCVLLALRFLALPLHRRLLIV